MHDYSVKERTAFFVAHAHAYFMNIGRLFLLGNLLVYIDNWKFPMYCCVLQYIPIYW